MKKRNEKRIKKLRNYLKEKKKETKKEKRKDNKETKKQEKSKEKKIFKNPLTNNKKYAIIITKNIAIRLNKSGNILFFIKFCSAVLPKKAINGRNKTT